MKKKILEYKEKLSEFNGSLLILQKTHKIPKKLP
jgi:hypothetical protein